MNLISWFVFMLGVTLAAPPDYYQILNVDYNATDAEIKAAYKKLAQTNHPDKPTGSEEKFKPIKNAWDTLSNPAKKSDYDKKINAFEKRKQRRKPIIVKPMAAAPFKKQTVKPLDPRLYRAEDVKVWGANASFRASTTTERKVKFPEFESNKQKPVYPVGQNNKVIFPELNSDKPADKQVAAMGEACLSAADIERILNEARGN
jgi:curved DNA-binding protein CbpA